MIIEKQRVAFPTVLRDYELLCIRRSLLVPSSFLYAYVWIYMWFVIFISTFSSLFLFHSLDLIQVSQIFLGLWLLI